MFGIRKKKKSKLYKQQEVFRVKRNSMNHIVSSGMHWKNTKHSALVYGEGRRRKRQRTWY